MVIAAVQMAPPFSVKEVDSWVARGRLARTQTAEANTIMLLCCEEKTNAAPMLPVLVSSGKLLIVFVRNIVGFEPKI